MSILFQRMFVPILFVALISACGGPDTPQQPSQMELDNVDSPLMAGRIEDAGMALATLKKRFRGSYELDYRAIRLQVRKIQVATRTPIGQSSSTMGSAIEDDYLGNLCGMSAKYLTAYGQENLNNYVVQRVYDLAKSGLGEQPCGRNKILPSQRAEYQLRFLRLNNFVEIYAELPVEW